MIGYLGPEKSFTFFATKKMHPQGALKAYENIQSLFTALKNDDVTGIVVPIENSTEGTINITIDLIYDYNLYINKELIQGIDLALIATHNDLSKIEHVVSHTHALAQCRETLSKHLGHYKEVGAASTSKSLSMLRDLDETHAVVASRNAVDEDLFILLDHVQDFDKNSTRFVYVTKELNITASDDKTSVICVPHRNYPGLLYDILHEFAIRRIDLSKIESRPNKKEPGTYNFYIDFDSNVEDVLAQEAINILNHKIQLKVLGSYKKQN